MHLGEVLERVIKSAKPRISVAKYGREYGYKSRVSMFNAFKHANPPLELFAFGVRRYNLEFPKEVMDKLEGFGIDRPLQKGAIELVSLQEHLAVVKKYNE